MRKVERGIAERVEAEWEGLKVTRRMLMDTKGSTWGERVGEVE